MLDGAQGVALVVAGLAAGFFNTVAGGGSLLSLPVLMLIGLPADVANGTNRLAVVTQSVVGAASFAGAGALPRQSVLPVLGPTLLGAILGAVVASRVQEGVLRGVLLTMLVGMALLLTLAPGLVTAEPDEEPRGTTLIGALGLFGAGLYGGFVQAGVGFLLLAVLGGLLRYDLVRANALKLVCTTVFGVAALGIFVLADQVAWVPGMVMAAAAVLGSRLGVVFATRVEPVVLRRLLLVMVLAACAGALWDGS